MRFGWLFPPPQGCGFCSRPVTNDHAIPLCPECDDEIGWIREPRCKQCGRQLDSSHVASRDVRYCQDCGRSPGDPQIINRAVVQYTPLARDVVSQFKYRGQETLAAMLGLLMADVVCREYGQDAVDLITFVPLHATRMAERGFNQAELLAHVIGKHLRRPVVELLVREKETPKQSKQTRQQRIQSIDGAFQLKKDFFPLAPQRQLLLVDDVYTTGATLRACARELSRAGFSPILAVTFAR